jgi:hypothetical protein
MMGSVNKVEIKKKTTNLFNYIFIIIKSSIFVGLISSFLFGIFRLIKVSSVIGFLDGAIFGLLLAIVLVSLIFCLDFFQRVKNYQKYKIFDFAVNQERKIIIKGEYNEIYTKLCDAVKCYSKFIIYNEDCENGIISARAKGSWRSFGEDIKIEITKGSAGKFYVNIVSRPKVFLTMFDYSKNFENVETILLYIEKSFDSITRK